MTLRRVLGGLALLLLVAFLGLYAYLPHHLPALTPNNREPGWDAGAVVHLLPTVSHERILLKASFARPLVGPRLWLGARTVPGVRTDTAGEFWSFDVPGLAPATTYELSLLDATGRPLCDPWPLKTFPAPDVHPERLRLLVFTGAGGHDAHIEWFGSGPLPLTTRTRLLRRALSFAPDALISSGDQIYFDLVHDASAKVMGGSRRSRAYLGGDFDRAQPVLGTENERLLKRAVDPQIAYLFGTACRSLPSFFLLDDHDYFENDFAAAEDRYRWLLLLAGWRSPRIAAGESFPADDFMLDLGRSAQKLYLPEFLPDEHRPVDLPGSGAPDRAPGTSECYGTLRYGRLLEGLLYESRRFLTLDGDDAVFLPRTAEGWLLDRMAHSDADHVLNIPAVVFGFSAGKWLEWYPDLRAGDGALTTARPKYRWQPGWLAQHDRLVRAASAMPGGRVPLFLCGDLHSQAVARITQTRGADLTANPVITAVSGSLGTGPRGWPSGFRGTVARPPGDLDVEELLPPVEKNGFVLVDLTPTTITLRFWAWRPPQPVAAIDTLEPYRTLVLERPGLDENQAIPDE